MDKAQLAQIKDLAKEILGNSYPDEKLESLLGRTDYADVIRPLITVLMKVRCPEGYPMTIRDPEEWAAIAEAVNIGIDSRLEAITRSTFDNGTVWIHPEEMGIFLDRLSDIAATASNEAFAKDPEHYQQCTGDDCKQSKIDGLVSCIITVMLKKEE